MYRVTDRDTGEVITLSCSKSFAFQLAALGDVSVQIMPESDDLVGLIIYTLDDDAVVGDGDLATIIQQAEAVEGAGRSENGSQEGAEKRWVCPAPGCDHRRTRFTYIWNVHLPRFHPEMMTNRDIIKSLSDTLSSSG